MAQKLVYIKLSEIIIDDTIYPRNDIDPETIARYREALEAGATLPPLVVMPDGRLLDGRHRYEAYKLIGVEEVEVIVEEPDDPDARAVELNLRHGRALTREEIREDARRKPVTEIAPAGRVAGLRPRRSSGPVRGVYFASFSSLATLATR